MSNGDDVLDNWEEIDEAGLCMTLQKKLQTANNVDDDETSSTKFKPARTADVAVATVASKMKLLQRPQSLQESGGGTTTVVAMAPKQIMIAKKPASAPTLALDQELSTAPVMMVLHKSNSEYDGVNYATPISNQTVKILRRPAQAEERRDSNGMRPKQPIKTLQQREQEYAQARLRILGSAKNPEDDKPPAATAPVAQATAVQAEQQTPPAFNFNNNNSGNSIVTTAPGMHRSSSAPKMSQTAPIYNNYNNYYQAPPTPAAMSYFYQQQQQQTPSSAFQQQQQQQTPPHYNQRMSPYVAAAAAAAPPQTPNTQQSWSPVVGGSVSAALLRQQSLHTPSLQQHQHQVPPPPYAHPYNDNVLRLPRGPCPNGTIGFQMRR